MKSKVFLTLLLLCVAATVQASPVVTDSLPVLTRDAFLSIVRSYHPVVRSAGLQVARAEAGIQQARGAFDPVAEASFDRKSLDGKLYYNYLNPQLSIPTWYGLALITGFERNAGERTNPERTLGTLTYAGAKLDLSSLWLDSRRAVLRQAQAIRTQSEAERRLAVNDLLYDALSAYYNWQQATVVQTIFSEALVNAGERLRFVRIEYEQGARPAMDTVEALTQLQSVQLQAADAAMAAQRTALDLANYLWLENGEPLPPGAEFAPEVLAVPSIAPSLDSLLTAAEEHPKILALRSKLDVLGVEQRLKSTYLLPKMSVKALALGSGYSSLSESTRPLMQNNSSFSVDVRLPVFLREARGAYREAGLKISQTRLEQDATVLAIQNKVRAAFQSFFILRGQEALAADAMQNYERLYSGERIKFEVGESTMFLLNSRQNKVIEASVKLAELRAKVGKAAAEMLAAAGLLG